MRPKLNFWANIIAIITTTLIFNNTQAQKRRAPDWIRQVPFDEYAFYGVGSANYKESDEYRTQARQMALRDITEKIFVSINTNSELTIRYEDKRSEYLLDETVGLESANFLSGHQKVDDWEDRKTKTYYVLYRLDRETYSENRRIYFQQIYDMVDMFKMQAKQLMDQGELVRSVNILTKGVLYIDEELDQLIEPENVVTLQKLRESLIHDMESRISRIDLKPQSVYNFNVDSSYPLVIDDFAIDRMTGKPLGRLQSKLIVLKGDVFHYAMNQDSRFNELSVYGVYPQDRRATVQLAIDLPLHESVVASIDQSIKTKLVSKPFAIEFMPYAVEFKASEIVDGELDIEQPLTKFVKNVTRDIGIYELELDNSFYRIETRSNLRIVDRDNGEYKAKYNAEVSIVRLSDNQEVFNHRLPTSYGYAKKRLIAKQKAVDRSVENSDQFLVALVTFLCSRRI